MGDGGARECGCGPDWVAQGDAPRDPSTGDGGHCREDMMLPPWLRGVAMEGLMGCVVTGDGVTCVRDATTTSSPSAATMSLQGQSHKHTTQVSDKPSSGRVMSGAYRAESATVIPSNRGRAICRVTSLPRFVSSGTTPDPTISVLNLPVQTNPPTSRRKQAPTPRQPARIPPHSSEQRRRTHGEGRNGLQNAHDLSNKRVGRSRVAQHDHTCRQHTSVHHAAPTTTQPGSV